VKHHHARLVLPPLGYALISLVATWPLLTHLHGWVPGSGDWGQNMWALWWTRYALVSLGQPPFFTHYLFYPEGVTLLFHPLDVADGLLALPLYGLLGGDVSYNLMVLLSFVLGGWGVYLLALYLAGQRAAAFIAGLIFVLSPYHFLRLDLGHLNLATLQWLPFYILFLLKFVQQGSRRSALLAVFCLVFTALHSWYYVLYCGLLTLAVWFWPGQATRFMTRLGRTTLVLGAAVVVLMPLLIPMVRLLGETRLVGAHNPLRHSVDGLSFWVPGPPSTWAAWFEDVWIAYAAQQREPGASAYLGYTVVGLCLIGLLGHARRRQAVWWLAVALGFTLLSLGPQLQIDGQLLDLPLPYHVLARLAPAFSITGIPGRFVVMTSLALSLLAAYGLAALAGWLPAKLRGSLNRPSTYLYLAVAALVGLEYLAAPLRLTRTGVAEFYHRLASEPEPYALIDLKWDANFLMHAQTVHGKPLVGGWLARLPEAQAAYLDQDRLDKAFLYLLLGPGGANVTDPASVQPALQAALTERNVRYIIDHDHAAGPWLEEVVGWPVVYESERLVVYGRR
jgi:hypothetical protein